MNSRQIETISIISDKEAIVTGPLHDAILDVTMKVVPRPANGSHLERSRCREAFDGYVAGTRPINMAT